MCAAKGGWGVRGGEVCVWHREPNWYLTSGLGVRDYGEWTLTGTEICKELQPSRQQPPVVGMFLDALQGKEQEQGEGRHGADLLRGSDWRTTLGMRDGDWLKVFQSAGSSR